MKSFFWVLVLGSGLSALAVPCNQHLTVLGRTYHAAIAMGMGEKIALRFDLVETDVPLGWGQYPNEPELERMVANLRTAALPIHRYAVSGTIDTGGAIHRYEQAVAYGHIARVKDIRRYLKDRETGWCQHYDATASHLLGADLNVADIDFQKYARLVPSSLDEAIEGFIYLVEKQGMATFDPRGIGTFSRELLDPESRGTFPLPFFYSWEVDGFAPAMPQPVQHFNQGVDGA